MNYQATKVEGQKLMFQITMKHNDEDIVFNVVCATDESEIDRLVKQYIDYLENPVKTIEPQPQTISIEAVLQQQQAMIEELKAEIAAMKGQ